MKLVIVSKALVVAGYRRKLEELSRLGVEVTAVVPDSWREGGGEVSFEHGENSSYSTIVSPLRLNGHFHLHYYPALPRLLRDLQPDIVHLDEEAYNLATYAGTRASVRLGIPSLFFTWQNIHRRYPFPFSALERSVYKRSGAAIAGSEEAADVLRRKGYAGPLAVVPQFGVDPEMFTPDPLPDGPFRIGFLNRLVPAKGPLLTLDAFERLSGNAELWLVGDGPLRDTLAREIECRGLQARVELRARVPSDEMPAMLRNFHAVVLPSLTTPRWKEQFGRILIEAMACGIPVVGSDSGEIPRVIGDAGLIVPEGDAEALAGALQTLEADAGLRQELGARGRKRAVALFSNAQVARETRDAYLLAMSGASRREM